MRKVDDSPSIYRSKGRMNTEREREREREKSIDTTKDDIV